MIDLSPELVTILMLGGVFVGVLTGYPLGIMVGAVTLIVGLFTLGSTPVFELLYQRSYSLVQNYNLLAVPLFVFMGLMLENSGIAGKLYDALYLWLSGFRGGLAIISVLIGTILAACVGVVAASVTMLTLVALPSMLRRGYDKSLTAGVCCAGGTLGILIPPSVMLVTYGPMAQISVGKLFMGAIFPGLLLSALYCGYIGIRCFLKPDLGPPVPEAERAVPFSVKTRTLLVSLVPPLALVVAVLGSIFMGVAPPTEAAAIGALAATGLAVAYRRFSWAVLKQVAIDTARIASFILFIAAMCFAFVGVFLHLGCGDVVQDFILSAPGGSWGAFFTVMFIVFLLGFFIDWIGIVFIIVPIVSPLVPSLGFDPVWFAIMVCVNLQMAFNTPPLAPAIFFAMGSVPPEFGMTTYHFIKGIMPFVGLIVLSLVICALFPEIITWLPGLMIR